MKVLVSGGSSGIGAAACLRIAEAALARGVQPMIAVCGHKRTTSQEEVVRSRWWATLVTRACQVNSWKPP